MRATAPLPSHSQKSTFPTSLPEKHTAGQLTKGREEKSLQIVRRLPLLSGEEVFLVLMSADPEAKGEI